MLIVLIAGVIACSYFYLQIHYLIHWNKTAVLPAPNDYVPSTPVTVVIVANNEEEHITSCIQSILHQNYPVEMLEIIVIDDRSTDNTIKHVEELNSPLIHLFRLNDFPEFIHEPSFKKSAIELAVAKAAHDWIVMSDADCTHGADWLRNITYTKEKTNPVFLTSPVILEGPSSLLVRMQQMENLALMVITAGGIKSGLHEMANGANMSFSKKAFHEVSGYNGNYQFPSGDDMFLIEKMKRAFPGRIAFLKNDHATAFTSAKTTWNTLLQQRTRWASKNKGLQNPLFNIIWIFVGIYFLFILLALIAAVFHWITWWPFLILFVGKIFADALLLYSASKFFQRKFEFLLFIPIQITYAFYLAGVAVRVISGSSDDWKKGL